MSNINETEVSKKQRDAFGSHPSHCCEQHGCKYGDDEDCPVFTSQVEQTGYCPFCVNVDDAKAKIAKLEKEIEWSLNIQKRLGVEISSRDDDYYY